MNSKIFLVLLALALATVVALVCVLMSGAMKGAKCGEKAQTRQLQHNDHSSVFSDLDPDEVQAVVEYLKRQPGMNLVDVTTANPSDNYIYLIEVQLPKKREALLFLDGGGSRPLREARAVVIFGAQAAPNITEYVVGPLPNPTYHKDVTLQKYNPLNFNARPVLINEYVHIYSSVFKREFDKAAKALKALFNFDGTSFASFTSSPRGFKSGERHSWFNIFQNISGFFLHPVGLEVLVDHSSLNTSEWRILQVFYKGQYFGGMDELQDRYNKRNLTEGSFNKVHPEHNHASLKPRVKPTTTAPLQVEPHGKQYSVKGNQLQHRIWSFAFGMSALSGLRLFDVRFKGERIAYELSVQEAIAIYGSNTAATMVNRYIDGSHGIGRFSNQLVRGVDCPYLATYVDTHFYIDSTVTKRHKNNICIFEHDTALPLRRHFSDLNAYYYGGLANTVLVIRTTATVGNYDYVWDFMFYQNGAIKVQVHPTGYISTGYLHGNGLKYGHRVGDNALGVMHTHSMSFKADLDVAGTDNSLLAEDMEFETVTVPWDSSQQLKNPKLIKKVVKTENDAAYKLEMKMPRYLNIVSNKTNRWGELRSYRIQIISFAGEHLPEDSAEEKGMSWARYKLAVTKHKDKELTSSSLYNQNDPWKPAVNFAEYIDNENIENQDLVAWISAGILHIPHAEDIPNTVTVGNGIGFFLRPFNYFNEDPSMESPDSVYLEKDQDPASCETNPVACLSKTASCAPDLPPFTYDGFDDVFNAF